MPIHLLINGWTEIPHSYAVVNCFQLIALQKKYNSELKLYIKEAEYYRSEWNNSKRNIYDKESDQILKSISKWNGEPIDLVYNITYPYDITPFKLSDGKIIPKCVFYTAEFAWLNSRFFKITNTELTDQIIMTYIKNPDNKLYFTAPSLWSAEGLRKWGIDSEKNKIITHGIDPKIFYKHTTHIIRKRIREFYGITDDEILLMNIGGMTQNKGIELILQAMHRLVNKNGLQKYKLLLKGTGDLYTSKEFLENYLNNMMKNNVMSKSDVDNLLGNHIIFTDKTLSYEKINDLYNAADIYLSPYLAEGFNLTTLEALSAGLSVIVPKTGSTREYINDIYSHNGNKFINFVESKILLFPNEMYQNSITVDDLYNTIIKVDTRLDKQVEYEHMKNFIEKNYSWERVADLLFDYFKMIKTQDLN